MNREEISKLVSDVLVENIGADPETIKEDADLRMDIGADSLDIVDSVIKLERKFDIYISDNDCIGMKTFGDLVSIVEKNLKKSAKT